MDSEFIKKGTSVRREMQCSQDKTLMIITFRGKRKRGTKEEYREGADTS